MSKYNDKQVTIATDWLTQYTNIKKGLNFVWKKKKLNKEKQLNSRKRMCLHKNNFEIQQAFHIYRQNDINILEGYRQQRIANAKNKFLLDK